MFIVSVFKTILEKSFRLRSQISVLPGQVTWEIEVWSIIKLNFTIVQDCLRAWRTRKLQENHNYHKWRQFRTVFSYMLYGHKATQQFRFGSAGFNMSIENCLYLRTDFGLQRWLFRHLTNNVQVSSWSYTFKTCFFSHRK